MPRAGKEPAVAVPQVTVPFTGGYDFGVGADLASGSPMGKVVDGSATPVGQAKGATVDFQVQRIHSTAELEQALNIDTELSFGCAAFGAGVSARFGFAKNSKVQSSSLFMSVTANVELEHLSINDPVLTDDAGKLVAHPDRFQARFGDMFVRGIARGGLFVGILRVDTSSSEESTAISAALSGAYGLFSGDAQFKFNEALKKFKTEVFVRMYHEGGPVELQITDPQDPLQLLNNANRFLQSFKDSPDQVARPYFVKLATTTIARGPSPPNAADIQHAQDVILFCAKRRSTILDQLNVLEYILDNPSKYDFTGGGGLDAIRKAAQDVQADLDLVAECASTAMNNPSATTKLPADFAEERGTTFPIAVLPNPMPVPKGGPTVEVPDFSTCTSDDACQALAAQNHLTVDTQLVTLGDFAVLSFTPPKGTLVPEGSLVTVLIRHPIIFLPGMLVGADGQPLQ